jgi:hypothetical protein
MKTKNKNRTVSTVVIRAMVIVGFMTNLAGAAVVIEEHFDYTVGSVLNGLNGGIGFDGAWANSGTGTNPEKVVTGKTFGSLEVSGGAIQRPVRDGNDASARTISDAAKAALTADGSTMWFSVLMEPGSNTNAYAVNSYGTLILGDAAFTGGGSGTDVPPIGAGGNAIGVGFAGTLGVTGQVWSQMAVQGVAYTGGTAAKSTPLTVGDTLVLIVGKVEWAADGTDDTVSFYNIVDPAAALPTTAFAALAVDLDQSGFDVMSIGDAQCAIFDEIRFGNTYEDVVAVDRTTPTVDAGIDMVTWSGEPVQLAPTVVNNHPTADLTYAWSADPVDGVAFSAADVEAPIVTITKTTENPSIVTLTLSVNNVGQSPDQAQHDTVTIDVYDDACAATKAVAPEMLDPTDLNDDCMTDLQDLIVMAQTWLVDYAPTGPIPQ